MILESDLHNESDPVRLTRAETFWQARVVAKVIAVQQKVPSN